MSSVAERRARHFSLVLVVGASRSFPLVGPTAAEARAEHGAVSAAVRGSDGPLTPCFRLRKAPPFSVAVPAGDRRSSQGKFLVVSVGSDTCRARCAKGLDAKIPHRAEIHSSGSSPTHEKPLPPEVFEFNFRPSGDALRLVLRLVAAHTGWRPSITRPRRRADALLRQNQIGKIRQSTDRGGPALGSGGPVAWWPRPEGLVARPAWCPWWPVA
jgi:hypothetical protein